MENKRTSRFPDDELREKFADLQFHTLPKEMRNTSSAARVGDAKEGASSIREILEV